MRCQLVLFNLYVKNPITYRVDIFAPNKLHVHCVFRISRVYFARDSDSEIIIYVYKYLYSV